MSVTMILAATSPQLCCYTTFKLPCKILKFENLKLPPTFTLDRTSKR